MVTVHDIVKASLIRDDIATVSRYLVNSPHIGWKVLTRYVKSKRMAQLIYPILNDMERYSLDKFIPYTGPPLPYVPEEYHLWAGDYDKIVQDFTEEVPEAYNLWPIIRIEYPTLVNTIYSNISTTDKNILLDKAYDFISDQKIHFDLAMASDAYNIYKDSSIDMHANFIGNRIFNDMISHMSNKEIYAVLSEKRGNPSIISDTMEILIQNHPNKRDLILRIANMMGYQWILDKYLRE
jgi:hypothetical protein